MFSTASDNQPAVTIHVLQGERPVASGNKSLGQFNLEDIPPAPRGMPEIEVTFDIDANGIVHVSARDKKTGRENNITIKSSSGLSETEIQKMVQDAEEHAEEDRKVAELAQARNQCDAAIKSTRSGLQEHGDSLTDDEKTKIDTALAAAEDAHKGDDPALMQGKIQALAVAAAALVQKMNKHDPDTPADGEGVVDAEFQEVADEEDGGK